MEEKKIEKMLEKIVRKVYNEHIDLNDELLTIKDLCKLLKRSQSHIRGLIKKKGFPVIYFDGKPMFSKKEVLTWIKSPP